MSTRPTFSTLIAGGGPAALEAALALREIAPAMRVELMVPEPEYVYRPLSVVEPFARSGARRYDYRRLADRGIAVRQDRLMRVEPDRHSVRTTHGVDVAYDALLVATGAQLRRAIPRCLTFGGPDDVERMHGLVQDIEGGYVRKLVFAAPPGASWTLPLYELALQTAERVNDLCLDSVKITVVSHEAQPLELFGDAAGELMSGLLQRAKVGFISSDTVPAADRIVALPVPAGHRIPGLPCDDAGFLAIDPQGRIVGVADVWAAGDCTNHPIKQGGLATQQASTAAAAIATAAGAAASEEDAGDPILRAMFVSGRQAYFLRRRLDGFDPGQASSRALWWPPSKIAGKRLSPFLDSLDAEASRETYERRHASTSAPRRLFIPKAPA
jgi:sulfide:quinone oxidoreductase